MNKAYLSLSSLLSFLFLFPTLSLSHPPSKVKMVGVLVQDVIKEFEVIAFNWLSQSDLFQMSTRCRYHGHISRGNP